MPIAEENTSDKKNHSIISYIYICVCNNIQLTRCVHRSCEMMMAVLCIPLRSDGKTDLTTDAAAVRGLAAILAAAAAAAVVGDGSLLLSCR